MIGQPAHQSPMAHCHRAIPHPPTSLGVSINRGTSRNAGDEANGRENGRQIL